MITNINTDGEFLTSWPVVPTSNRIGSQASIPNSHDGVGGIDLHSQALLTAFLQSGGLDTVLDYDGVGEIQIDGAAPSGGAQYGDSRGHRDDDKQRYVEVDDQTLTIDRRASMLRSPPKKCQNPHSSGNHAYWTIAANDRVCDPERSAA